MYLLVSLGRQFLFDISESVADHLDGGAYYGKRTTSSFLRRCRRQEAPKPKLS